MLRQLLSVRKAKEERGSLALEQVLFIGAVVALSAGVFIFYDNLSAYFSGITFTTPPHDFGGRPAAAADNNSN